jgi:hypothetical protein
MAIERTQLPHRILALEIRPRIIGFVVAEAPMHFLDWGTRKIRVGNKEFRGTMANKVGALLDYYAPAIVVMRQRRIHSPIARGRIKAGFEVIRKEAANRLVDVQTISTDEIHQFFAFNNKGGTTKHTVAMLIAGLFPELSWKLPPKRKSWKSEDHRMVIFDAAATGLTFLNRSPPSQN